MSEHDFKTKVNPRLDLLIQLIRIAKKGTNANCLESEICLHHWTALSLLFWGACGHRVLLEVEGRDVTGEEGRFRPAGVLALLLSTNNEQ